MKKGLLKSCCLVFSLALSFAGQVAGQPGPEPVEDFFELDLSQLGNIVVTVASSKGETIPETPAIVSRYNTDDLAAMGLRTLKDMLGFIPGLELNDTTSGPTSVMIRGIYEPYNQKVLFLLDDVPYWMPSHGEIPLLGIPLEAIDHIEIIRGPGAVYYGTNATAGVIKVVTRDHGGNRVALRAGSNGLVNGGGYYRYDFGAETALNIGFEGQHDDGYQGYFANADGRTITEAEEMGALLARFTHKDFNFMGQVFSSTVNGVSGARTFDNYSDVTSDGYLLHANYTLKFSKADLKLFTDYNNFHIGFEVANLLGGVTDGGFRFENDGVSNYRWRGGGSIDYAWSKRVRLFGGAEYEKRSSGDYQMYNEQTGQVLGNVIDAVSLDEASLYGQIDFNTRKWRFLAGGRYTDNDQSGEEVTPRLAAVYKIDSEKSLKLLYSVGFNVPNFTQSKASLPGIVQGESDLVAETVQSTDLAFTFARKNTLFVANVFYLKAENFIQRVTASGGGITFFNANSFERYGGELDLQHTFGDLKLFANLAYHDQGDEIKDDDGTALFVPKVSTAVGVSYSFLEQHSIGGSLRTISDRGEAGALELLNIDYNYRHDDFEFFTTIRNLFDHEILNPDVEGRQDILIVGGDGLNFFTGVRYHF